MADDLPVGRAEAEHTIAVKGPRRGPFVATCSCGWSSENEHAGMGGAHNEWAQHVRGRDLPGPGILIRRATVIRKPFDPIGDRRSYPDRPGAPRLP